MRRTILTFIITLAVLIAGFYIFITSGAYNISQLSPHNALTKSIIGITTHNSIEKRMKENVVPGNLKEPDVIALGFKNYNEMCSGCHGTPGTKPEEMPQGWYPKPPMLFKQSKEEDAQEFFWITKNGIKMTSMPAFKPILDDEKIWAVIAFVTQKLPQMTAEEYNVWIKKYAEQK